MRWTLLAALLLCAACKQSPLPAQPSAALSHPWPTTQHDNRRTNATLNPAPVKPRLLWRTQLSPKGADPSYSSPPVIAAGNIVYVATEHRKLHRVDPNGSITWTLSLRPALHQLALLPDGSLLVAGADLLHVSSAGKQDRLRGLDINLGPLLQAEDNYKLPLIEDDGSLWINNWRGAQSKLTNNADEVYELTRLGADGSESQTYRKSGVTMAPIASDGTHLYITDTDDGLIALDNQGSLAFKLHDASWLSAIGPLLTDNGVIVVNKQRDSVLWLDKQLNVISSASSGGLNALNRAYGSDGSMFVCWQQSSKVGSGKRPLSRLIAYDKTGRIRWKKDCPDAGNLRIALAGSTLLVLSSADEELSAFKAESASPLWTVKVPRCTGSPVVGEDAVVYVIDKDGGLNAFGEAAKP